MPEEAGSAYAVFLGRSLFREKRIAAARIVPLACACAPSALVDRVHVANGA